MTSDGSGEATLNKAFERIRENISMGCRDTNLGEFGPENLWIEVERLRKAISTVPDPALRKQIAEDMGTIVGFTRFIVTDAIREYVSAERAYEKRAGAARARDKQKSASEARQSIIHHHLFDRYRDTPTKQRTPYALAGSIGADVNADFWLCGLPALKRGALTARIRAMLPLLSDGDTDSAAKQKRSKP